MDAYEIVRVFLTEGWAAGKPSPERQKAIEALGSVRAEARAEALLKAAERAVAWYRKGQIIPAHINSYAIKELRAAILADEPKERDGAITWSSFEVGMLAAMMTGNLEKDTATLAMYLLDEPKEREAEAGDIVAWVNSTGDVIVGQFGKEITQGDAVIIVRRDVVERKLKEAEV